MNRNDSYKAAIRQVLAPYACEEMAEIERAEAAEHEYSACSMAKIGGILSSGHPRSTMGTGRRIGIGILAAILLAGVTCGAVEPIREKIANAFLYRKLNGKDAMVIIDFDGTASDSEGSGIPLYIPDGFEAEEKRCGESSITCVYRNGTGDWFAVTGQAYNEWSDMQYAYREGTFVPESVIKDGREYLLLRPAEDGGNNAVMWAEDGYAFCIETTLAESEMLKIADGITAECEIFTD